MSEAREIRAAIVTIGNELLYGETVDTNAAWLGRRLAARGIRVVRRFTVGDDEDDIDDALGLAMGAADLVIMSGGLGPTPDDLTKAAVARRLGRPLVVDEAVEAALRRHFEDAGYEDVPKLSRGQAEVPEGAVALENPSGTAPGILIEEGDVRVVLLPGVPRELEGIVDGALAPYLDRMAGGQERAHHRVVHTTGVAETSLAERLEPRLEELPAGVKEGIDLAYLPDLRGVDLRFTIRGGSVDDADARFDGLVEELDEVLGPWRFEAESGDVAEAVLEALRERGWRLAVAESCTGGLVGKRLTDPAGASDVFVGGVIAYDNEVKIGEVGVDRGDLERDGAVSESVALQLAAGVAQRFGVEAGIGVTGVAGPGGGSDDKPVGSVWIATSLEGEAEARLHRFPGDRSSIRERAAQAALAALFRRVASEGPDG
jgi:nicotinamide-nucleotide amidase